MASSRKSLISWMVYDFAAHSYVVTILVFLYPVYFKGVVAKGLGNEGDFYWGLAFGLSMGIAAVGSPLFGAVADQAGNKKKFLIVTTLLTISFTASLSLVGQGMVFWGMLLFILANICFQGGSTFYNAFLPELAGEKNLGKISGWGWALGYAGAIAMIFLARPFLTGEFDAANLSNVRRVFLLTAAFYLAFSLPLFFWLVEARRAQPVSRSAAALMREGIGSLGRTFRNIRQYKEVFKFLLAYLIYIDGVTTAIAFSSIFARDTLHFSLPEIGYLAILIMITGIAGALLFGWVADRLLPKRTILITLSIWLAVVLAVYLNESKPVFFVIAAVAGVVVGASQSVSRSMMGLLTPEAKKTEFFGFFGACGRFSAIFGPPLFGAVSQATNSQRLAILSLLVFFGAGITLLSLVREGRGVEQRAESDRVAVQSGL